MFKVVFHFIKHFLFGLFQKKDLIHDKKEEFETVIPLKVLFKEIEVVELPNELKEMSIYVVGENGFFWMAALNCPCGCGDVIQLNLLKEARPCWSIIHHKNGLLSISPSVRRIINCESHFTINKSNIKWWENKKTYYQS